LPELLQLRFDEHNPHCQLAGGHNGSVATSGRVEAVCSAYDGYSPTVTNLSVHSGTSATFRQKAPPAVQFDREKAYIAFTRSDGGGWNFQRHYYRKLFNDRAHGAVPVGRQIGPTATDGISVSVVKNPSDVRISSYDVLQAVTRAHYSGRS
jgi:hypothetical protein